MQIYESKMFPAQLPVIVEDELFLYPFMITPLFLNDEENIEALNLALESQSPILVVPTKPQNEGAREFDAIYDAGVIGTIDDAGLEMWLPPAAEEVRRREMRHREAQAAHEKPAAGALALDLAPAAMLQAVVLAEVLGRPKAQRRRSPYFRP